MRTALFNTLRFKIALFILILLLVTASLFSILTIQTMNRHILDEVMKRAESLCKTMAALAPYSILSSDALGIDNVVAKIKGANPDVVYVAVTNAGMKILSHTDVSRRGETFTPYQRDMITKSQDGTCVYEVPFGTDRVLEIVAPIVFNNKQMGQVIIGIDKSVLYHARAETRRRITAGLGITMLLGLGCIVVLSSVITRPIKELSRGVEELKQGRQSTLRIYSHDELGSLTASFNQMTRLTTSQQAKIGAYARELEEAYVSTVKVLSAAIDARDPYTHGHSLRVANLGLKIGAAIGLSRLELEELEIASLFHDVGKLKTPDFVLLKDGPLDPQEHREISNHSEYGAAILSRAPSLQKYIPAVRHHHEWFNGEGYPDGLSGSDIPLYAAIITVADAYDAMTSARPYKRARSREEALQELVRCAGKQFDPCLVKAFREAIESDSPAAERSAKE